MPSCAELYPLVHAWMQALPALRPRHSAVLSGLAHLVTALLVGPSLRPTAVMRALLSPVPVPARQRYKRLARAWDRPWLSPAWLTPCLVPAALALVAPDPPGRPTAGLTHLVLDSVHCGGWEVFTLGVVWHGRVLLVGWAVLPAPLPKGRFTPTVCALVRQVAASWPAERPVHLVADRGFPSRARFQVLHELGWGWTIRLRAANFVRVDAGPARRVRTWLDEARANAWSRYPRAQFTPGLQAPSGELVIGRGLPVLPWHQRGAASLRARADQDGRRQHHVAHKHPRQRPDASCQTDTWMVLFSSHLDWLPAVTSYSRRWAIEGSYRDAKTGWDGQHGWDLATTLARLSDAVLVERIGGLWALGAALQTGLGPCVSLPEAEAPRRLGRREWTTTGRLSVWARGQLALTDPRGRLRPWLRQARALGARQLQAGPLLASPPDPLVAHLPPDQLRAA